MEGLRGGGARRVQIVRLLDHKAEPSVAAKSTPSDVAYAVSDLSVVKAYAAKSQGIDVKVYGRKSGYITYRRTPKGSIEKTYVDFSDENGIVYSGRETMQANPRGRSTYTAGYQAVGAEAGSDEADDDLRAAPGRASGRTYRGTRPGR
jgi:hypothetical protein